MTTDQPLVSIGVTVYNAERFLEETLQSLLAQDYGNVEINLSDNASNDGSPEIYSRYASQDERVHFSRNPTNLGSVKNWNRALEMATGQYFMWAADHDLWDPTYISKTVAILESDPSVALVYPRTRLIDHQGKTIIDLDDRMDTRGMETVDRFRHVAWNLKACNMVHGVMRTSMIKTLGGFPNAWAMDAALIPAIAVWGSFCQLDEFLFLRRENRPDALMNHESASREFQMSQLDPAKASQRARTDMVRLRQETRDAMLALIRKAPVSQAAKLHCQAIALNAFWSRYGVGFYGLQSIRRLIPKGVRRTKRTAAAR